jgi:hypothetical protein
MPRANSISYSAGHSSYVPGGLFISPRGLAPIYLDELDVMLGGHKDDGELVGLNELLPRHKPSGGEGPRALQGNRDIGTHVQRVKQHGQLVFPPHMKILRPATARPRGSGGLSMCVWGGSKCE